MGDVQFVPDISHHQEDISIRGLMDAGAAALIARVGQGAGRRTNGQTYSTTRDRKWQRNLAEAKRLGLLTVPYWYIGNLISASDNARLAAEWVGDTTLPWMLDQEDASGSIAFYREVVAAFTRRGLRVVLSYIPQWYWSSTGQRASLAGLPPLVNSRYVTASGPPTAIYPGDNAPGWTPFGGNTVALLQFTNRAAMAGRLIDCSAFRGTKTQLIALLGGNQEKDMDAEQARMLYNLDRLNSALLSGADTVTRVQAPDGTLTEYQLAFVKDIAELKARPATDVDEAALAAELDARGWDPATAAEVKEIVLGAFARGGQQPETPTTT